MNLFKAFASPFTGTIDLILGTSITKKMWSGNDNSPSKQQVEEAKLIKAQNDKIEELKAKLEGFDKNMEDKVKEAIKDKLGGREPLTPREKKEKLEEIKKMSKEEKADLLKDLKDENVAEQKAINKVLQEKLDKQEKTSIQLAEELRKAKESGDPAQIAKVAAMMKDNDKNQQATRLALKKNEENAKKQEQLLEKYFQSVEQDKPWFLDMNFKSPWLWVALTVGLILVYFLFRTFMWIWGKIKSAIWGDK